MYDHRIFKTYGRTPRMPLNQNADEMLHTKTQPALQTRVRKTVGTADRQEGGRIESKFARQINLAICFVWRRQPICQAKGHSTDRGDGKAGPEIALQPNGALETDSSIDRYRRGRGKDERGAIISTPDLGHGWPSRSPF